MQHCPSKRHTRRLVLLALIASILIAALTMQQTPAAAHGYLIRALPANGAVLQSAPTRIQLWFSERLEPQFSTLTLTDDRGNTIPLEDNGVKPNNPALLTARIPSTLPNGAYVVTLRIAFSSDGHVQTETLIFWVGEKSGELAAQGPTGGALPLEILWRLLTLGGVNVLFGVTLLYQLVLIPAWGNPVYRAGKLPPRVMVRLNVIVWIALIVAAVGTVLAILQQSAVLFNTEIDAVITNRLWQVVLNSTQVGSSLTLRIGLLVAVAAIHWLTVYISDKYPDFVSILWAINVVIVAALLGTLSASSHAAGVVLAGSPFWPYISVGVDWLHVLANAAWVGGLTALAFVLPAALGPLKDPERQNALGAALRRFSRMAATALGLLIVSGVYSAALEIPRADDLTQSNYGLTLTAKVLLVLPLLVIALYNHLITAPGRLTTLANRFGLTGKIERLIGSVRVEVIVGTVVVVLAAILSATPPPPPQKLIAQEPPAQETTLAVTGGNLRVKLSSDPGAVGANTYEVMLWLNDRPINDAQVIAQFVYPALDKRSDALPLDNAGGVYIGAGEQMSRVGQWNILLDVTLAGSESPIRAAFRWDVQAAAPVSTQRQPTALNYLSGIVVLLSILIVIGRGLRTLTRGMVFHPESVAIAITAAIAAIVLLIFTSWALDQAGQRSDALSNPVPVVTNPILADQKSLAAGESLFTKLCASCHVSGAESSESSNAAPDLHSRVPNRRDEALYAAIKGHKGDVAEQIGALSDADLWNVINYLRANALR